MKRKERVAVHGHSKVLEACSKRFGDTHKVKSSRTGLLQFRINDAVVKTLDGEHHLSLGHLKRTYAQMCRRTDKLVVELHNYNSTERFEFLSDAGVWLKTTDTDGLV